jgi:NADP-dependent 3-hydroxy acid dehydrogenase YdfG
MTAATKLGVVTGVTSGIGLATTKRLIASGVAVIGLGRNEDRLRRLTDELGPAFSPIKCDLGSAVDRAECARALRAMGRGIDLFVSNAGECVFESPLEVEPERLRRLFDVNVCAPLELCRALSSHFVRGAHFVQISSVTARFMPSAKYGPYAASKVASERLTEALRHELQPRGVKVSLVVPGLVDTPIYEKVAGFEETRAKLEKHVSPWLSAEDVADTILWMTTRPAHVVVSELVLFPNQQTR